MSVLLVAYYESIRCRLWLTELIKKTSHRGRSPKNARTELLLSVPPELLTAMLANGQKGKVWYTIVVISNLLSLLLASAAPALSSYAANSRTPVEVCAAPP